MIDKWSIDHAPEVVQSQAKACAAVLARSLAPKYPVRSKSAAKRQDEIRAALAFAFVTGHLAGSL